MEEELNIKNTEIVEDMPDFEENTAEMPCEDAESVDKCTDIAENENVSEEIESETEEIPADSAETETETKTEEKKEEKADYSFYQFNPLQMAIKPFYDKALAEDEYFAQVVKEKENRKEHPKSLAECAEYIMGEAFKYASSHRSGNMGLAGMPDEDMPSLIKHYYFEDNIEIHKVTGARAKVTKTTSKTPTAPAKGKDKPKPVKNVVDITKAIVSATKPKEDGKKAKKEKKKDNLLAGFVPMERPDADTYTKDAKKGSREQAKSVVQMDMFADFFSE